MNINNPDVIEYYETLQTFGFGFFPLKPNSKIPACKWKDEQTSEFEHLLNIDKNNIGVAIPDHFIIIDTDTAEANKHLLNIDGFNKETLTIKTRKGFHYYNRLIGIGSPYQFQNNHPVFGKGVDSRIANKGYVVGAGSVIDGNEYVIHNNAPIATFTPEFEKVVCSHPKTEKPPRIAKNERKSCNGGGTIREGGRDATLTHIAGRLVNQNLRNGEIVFGLDYYNQSCEPPLPESDIERIAGSIGKREPTGECILIEPHNHKIGTLERCFNRLGLDIRFNEVSLQYEIRGGEWNNWEPITDEIESLLIRNIGMNCIEMPRVNHKGEIGNINSVHTNKETFGHSIKTAGSSNKVNPFVSEYLNTLTPIQPDHYIHETEGCIHRLLIDLFDLGDDPNNIEMGKWVSLNIYLSIVQRVYEPGCFIKQMPILIGNQSIGKSLLCHSILPPQWNKYFTEGLLLSADDKRFVEQIRGKIVAEASELVGLGKADIERVKLNISRREDNVRLAYRRDNKDYPRICSLIGTTNLTQSLPDDESGNTRFVPVELKGRKIDDLKQHMNKYVDKYFAQALWLYNNGERVGMNNKQIEIQTIQTDEYRQFDYIIETAFDDALDKINENAVKFGDGSIGIKMDELTKYIIMAIPRAEGLEYDGTRHIDKPTQNRIIKIATRRGFNMKRKYIDGIRGRYWIIPNNCPETIDIDDVPF